MNTGEFINKWRSVLTAYGTPADFADSTVIKLINDPNNTKNIPIRLFIASGYLKRKDLMQKSREEKNQRQDKLQIQLSERADCFLCDNIIQAEEKGDNIIFPWNYYENTFVCPNRFPYVNGHCLLVAKTHDPSVHKVGNTITKNYLENIIELSERYNLSVSRNHPQAGMSIPDHEHCHLRPRLIKIDSNKHIIDNGLGEALLIPTNYGKNIFKVEMSDFDTIVFKDNSPIEIFLSVLKKLERNNIIFTFLYDNNSFYLTPHIKQHEFIGSGDPAYFLVPQPGIPFDYRKHIDFLKEHIFNHGSFPWSDYF